MKAKYVCCLDISMSNMIWMKVLKAQAYLVDTYKWFFFRECFVHYYSFEISTLSIICNNICLFIFIFESFYKFYNEGIREIFKNLYFSNHAKLIFELISLIKFGMKSFYGNFFWCISINCFLHKGETTLAYIFPSFSLSVLLDDVIGWFKWI